LVHPRHNPWYIRSANLCPLVIRQAQPDVLPKRPNASGEDWRPYVVAAIHAGEGFHWLLTERKTGLYVPNVETTRLIRDERGWVRLTG